MVLCKWCKKADINSDLERHLSSYEGVCVGCSEKMNEARMNNI